MPKLSKRLKEVCDLIVNANNLADIGADHGQLIVNAILCGRAVHGYAVDISAESLNKARRYAEEYGVEGNIDFFVGDGLDPIASKQADYTVIAGMGGINIAGILARHRLDSTYILVPHQDGNVLREFLRDNQYHIEKDFVIKDKKFYSVIIATLGDNNYKDDEIYFGKNFPPTEDFTEYVNFRKDCIQTAIERGGQKISSELSEEWEEIKKWL